jgi:hypothetical protein
VFNNMDGVIEAIWNALHFPSRDLERQVPSPLRGEG